MFCTLQLCLAHCICLPVAREALQQWTSLFLHMAWKALPTPLASGEINSATFDWDADGSLSLCGVRLSLCPSTVKKMLHRVWNMLWVRMSHTSRQSKEILQDHLANRQQGACWGNNLSNVKHQPATSWWSNKTDLDWLKGVLEHCGTNARKDGSLPDAINLTACCCIPLLCRIVCNVQT